LLTRPPPHPHPHPHPHPALPFARSQTAAFVAGADAVAARTAFAAGALRSLKVLNAFSAKVVEKCYLPVMKSLKDEFRRESDRLVETDTPKFFKIVRFFSAFQRTVLEDSNAVGNGTGSVGDLLITLDSFCWKMVSTKMEECVRERASERAGEECVRRGERYMLLLRCCCVTGKERNAALPGSKARNERTSSLLRCCTRKKNAAAALPPLLVVARAHST
jgi:hypothetical protein